MELSPHSPDFACCDFPVSRIKLFHTRNTFRQREARTGPYHRVPASVPGKGLEIRFRRVLRSEVRYSQRELLLIFQ
jgi:hypothetical protein